MICPLVAKFTSACLAGSRFPLPDTTLSITPLETVTVRSDTVLAVSVLPRLR